MTEIKSQAADGTGEFKTLLVAPAIDAFAEFLGDVLEAPQPVTG